MVWIMLVPLSRTQGSIGVAQLADEPASNRGQEGCRPFVPTREYVDRPIQGWTVRVNRSLLEDRRELGAKALALLDRKLAEIAREVPGRACAQLRKVPIWLGVDDGHAPCAEYHPSSEWLRSHGYNPDKAKAVEIGNAARFLEWSADQPSMVLHELAHAYRDRVLGYDNPTKQAAYARAAQGRHYDRVRHKSGKLQKAYALENARGYFAEGTEALFGRNDFYPFSRDELKRHDPELYSLLERLWAE
jgi:hypothetical protein